MSEERFYEAPQQGARRSAPAALRNREPIAEVLAEWLPESGTVLEIASGTGEHVVHFAERFPRITWQPSDLDPGALGSIAAWREAAALPNIKPPVVLDAASADWPIDRAKAVLSINMVHISPWASALGLLDGAGRLLAPSAPLILYGPWLRHATATAPSNLDFNEDLKRRNPQWGLRTVEVFVGAAEQRGFALEEQREMPANNLMLLLRRR